MWKAYHLKAKEINEGGQQKNEENESESLKMRASIPGSVFSSVSESTSMSFASTVSINK
jgi:hypothetical protein